MQKPYVAPELKLVGEAGEVVLGSGGTGHDIFGEFQPNDGGYQPDDQEEEEER